jgi:hypothetical protein
MENQKYAQFTEESKKDCEGLPKLDIEKPKNSEKLKESIAFDKILSERIGFGKFQLFSFIIFGKE